MTERILWCVFTGLSTIYFIATGQAFSAGIMGMSFGIWASLFLEEYFNGENNRRL